MPEKEDDLVNIENELHMIENMNIVSESVEMGISDSSEDQHELDTERYKKKPNTREGTSNKRHKINFQENFAYERSQKTTEN